MGCERSTAPLYINNDSRHSVVSSSRPQKRESKNIGYLAPWTTCSQNLSTFHFAISFLPLQFGVEIEFIHAESNKMELRNSERTTVFNHGWTGLWPVQLLSDRTDLDACAGSKG
jgi:hypothetical protein